MIWDLTDIETIIRAERFMETLDKECVYFACRVLGFLLHLLNSTMPL